MGRVRKYTVELGQRFGRLTVIEETRLPGNSGYGVRGAICVCDCGNRVAVPVCSLGRNTRSCGCIRRELAPTRGRPTHGLSAHPLFPTWKQMMQRCCNEKAPNYHLYGGRTDVTGGITVCPRWHDPAAFIKDIERLLGPRPEGMTLDRKRNGLGYKPSNVRWATAKEQAANRRQRGK